MYSLFQLVADEWLRNLLHIMIICAIVYAGWLLEPGRSSECDQHDPFDTRDHSSNGSLQSRLLEDLPMTLLVIALTLGVVLRFYGIDWGLPHAYHPDEFEEARFLRKMMVRDTINPDYSQQPPLILYLSWPISVILKYFGIYDGNTIVRNVLAGRIVNALAGSISLALVFLLGARLRSRLTGALAALLVAVSPLHITNSRYMKQDALMVMFVIACALTVIKGVQERRRALVLLAGVFAGLAAGSKYSGAACIAILFSAPWLAHARLTLRPALRDCIGAIGAGGVMVITFFLSMPYVFFSARNFASLMGGIEFESRHARTGHHGFAIDPWSQLWMFHFSRSLVPALDVLAIGAALFAAGMLLRRGQSTGLWLIGLVLIFYLPAEWARSKPPPQPDRYVLPCLPFVALLAGEMISTIRGRLKRSVLVCGTVAMIALPLARSMLLASEIQYDSRERMTDWLATNLPRGSKILLAGGSAYLPKIPNGIRGVSARKVVGRDKSQIIDDLRRSGYEYLLTSNLSSGRFAVQNVSKGNERPLAVRDAFRRIDQTFPLVKLIVPQFGSYGFHNPTVKLYSLKARPTETSDGSKPPLSAAEDDAADGEQAE